MNDEEGLLVPADGNGDGVSEEIDTPGPIIESIDGHSDGADIPVPDDGTDFDLDDDTFWQKWQEEIRMDEFPFVGLQERSPGQSGAPQQADNQITTTTPYWEPCPQIEYELYDWSNNGFDPTVFIAIHAHSTHNFGVLTNRSFGASNFWLNHWRLSFRRC